MNPIYQFFRSRKVPPSCIFREKFAASVDAFRASQQGADLNKTAETGVAAGGQDDLPLIVLDPGHGGIDYGAHGEGGAFEKDVVLAFAKVLGTKSKSVSMQADFVSKLSDTLTAGVGNLVDADLAKESAKLQALQTKQQLGIQALSIANQGPQTILSLFK